MHATLSSAQNVSCAGLPNRLAALQPQRRVTRSWARLAKKVPCPSMRCSACRACGLPGSLTCVRPNGERRVLEPVLDSAAGQQPLPVLVDDEAETSCQEKAGKKPEVVEDCRDGHAECWTCPTPRTARTTGTAARSFPAATPPGERTRANGANGANVHGMARDERGRGTPWSFPTETRGRATRGRRRGTGKLLGATTASCMRTAAARVPMVGTAGGKARSSTTLPSTKLWAVRVKERKDFAGRGPLPPPALLCKAAVVRVCEETAAGGERRAVPAVGHRVARPETRVLRANRESPGPHVFVLPQPTTRCVRSSVAATAAELVAKRGRSNGGQWLQTSSSSLRACKLRNGPCSVTSATARDPHQGQGRGGACLKRRRMLGFQTP